MPKAALIDAYTDWRCPACGKTARTRPLPPNASQMHVCPKLKGITSPMVRAGVKSKVTAVMREDYVGGDIVTLDENKRAVMSVVTERDNGQDVAVFAPLATLGAGVPR